MLSALILVVFLLCYCCHRSTNKNLQYWQEQPEVFTVDEQVSRLAMRGVHSFRYCSQGLNWVWHRSRFLVVFKTSNNRDGSAHTILFWTLLFHLHVSIIVAQWLQILLRIRNFPNSSFTPHVGCPEWEFCDFLHLLYTYSRIIPQIRLCLIEYNSAICGYKKSE